MVETRVVTGLLARPRGPCGGRVSGPSDHVVVAVPMSDATHVRNVVVRTQNGISKHAVAFVSALFQLQRGSALHKFSAQCATADWLP